jgi:sortase (surface protein transpeptidase)
MLRIIVAALLAVLVIGCSSPATETSPRPKSSTTATTKPTTPPVVKPKAEKPLAKVADPGRVKIPAIGVNATMVGVGLKSDGAMATPAYDANQAGWYTKGPRPGEVGPAVIVAHVDSKTGPDVFWRLREIERGDRIAVTDKAGDTHAFTVQRLERVDKDALPYEKIWGATDRPVLRLVTCGGSYDRAAGEYRDNLIVYADGR